MRILLFFTLFIFPFYSFSQQCNCNHYIYPSQLVVNGNDYNVVAGDTICIMAGYRDYLSLVNFMGDSSNYIVFINCGGDVIVKNNYHLYGISISNCRYFQLTGTGDSSSEYGIKILETKQNINGLTISSKSSDYEIDHIEVANTGFAGFMLKTDPSCDTTLNFGNFTQFNTLIHSNYIHNTNGEGMYIGHAYYGGYPINCNGQADTVYPHSIKGLKVFNNIIDSSGWDGIQVGCADENCEIFGNIITNYGTKKVNGQNSGIQIGGGTTGKCYNNFVSKGSGTGITVFGNGNNTIFNNIIYKSGYNYFQEDNTKKVYGIFCDDRTTILGNYFNFINNTIVEPKTDGIRFYSLLSDSNYIINNIIVKPGSYGSYSDINQSFIYLLGGVDVVKSNNYFYQNCSQILFTDSLNENFQIVAGSPAIDAGIDATSFGITYDFNFNPRPYNIFFDIGAFEYQSNSIISPNNYNNYSVNIYPNPSHGKFNIIIANDILQQLTDMYIIDFYGNIVLSFEKQKINTFIKFEVNKIFSSGLYFLVLQTKKAKYFRKIILM